MPVVALLGIALVGLFAMSWLLNRDALRSAVETQIRAVTGLDLVVHGPVDVSVFPGSYVSFHDVGLKGGGSIDPALSVDVLTANLRLLPLLTQRFEISDLMMLRPRINVVRDAAGNSNWTPFIETIARTMKPGADHPLSFSEIRIQDGELSYQDPVNNERIGDIDLSLALALDLALVRRHRPVRLAGRADRRQHQRQRFHRRFVRRPLRAEGEDGQRPDRWPSTDRWPTAPA